MYFLHQLTDQMMKKIGKKFLLYTYFEKIQKNKENLALLYN